MNYIILDLEWNSAFSKEKNKYICEIFEIGAVKLNENFEAEDSFYEVIKPQILNSFNHRIIELTKVNLEELEKARILAEVMADFENFVDEDSVIMTWSRSDIPVLIENYGFISAKNKGVPFLKRYLDLQVLVQSVLNISNGNQISLTNAADMLNIYCSDIPPHRAINDSIISARCFKAAYNKDLFKKYLFTVDDNFYKKLFFKVKYISKIRHPAINKSDLVFHCEECGKKLRKKTGWRFKNRTFFSIFKCPDCKIKYKCTLQVKETYDRIVKTKKLHKIVENEEEKID